jgi:outer membrane lipopolysaccharide assembly protein LptE/RlpB
VRLDIEHHATYGESAVEAAGCLLVAFILGEAKDLRGIFRMNMPQFLRSGMFIPLLAICLLLAGCGYHTANHASIKLPSGIDTIAVPIFINKTNSYRAEQVLTEAVVREFTGRSPYKVLPKDDGTADAVLHGTVVTTNVYPLTYDSQTGRQSSAIVQINMSVKLVDKHGKTLFENPNYSFREQYQVSREVTSFFDESPPAVERLSRDFARTLVAEILEGF